jgi:hypothetical protein
MLSNHCSEVMPLNSIDIFTVLFSGGFGFTGGNCSSHDILEIETPLKSVGESTPSVPSYPNVTGLPPNDPIVKLYSFLVPSRSL